MYRDADIIAEIVNKLDGEEFDGFAWSVDGEGRDLDFTITNQETGEVQTFTCRIAETFARPADVKGL